MNSIFQDRFTGRWNLLDEAYHLSHSSLEKSYAMLMENLNDGQRGSFIKYEHFDIISQAERYRLSKDITTRLRDGTKYCVIFPGLPLYDQILARKLFLECNPEEFFRVANVFSPPGANYPNLIQPYRSTGWYMRNGNNTRAYSAGRHCLSLIVRQLGLHLSHFELSVVPVDFARQYEFKLKYRDDVQVFQVDARHDYTTGFENIIAQQIELAVHLLTRAADTAAAPRHLQHTAI